MTGYTVYGRPLPHLPPFRPQFPWRGGDLQTIKNTLHWHAPHLPNDSQTRLTFPMDDGTGDCLLGLLDQPAVPANRPLIVLVHGLTGCEESRNIMTSAAHFVAAGYPVLRLNLRGAGPSLGKCQEHYHAGRTEDLVRVVDHLPAELTAQGVVLVGVSLGGNTVLKLMGSGSVPDCVVAAVSVCAPIDLKAAQRRIMAPRNRVYHRYLINRMTADAKALPGFAQSDWLPDALARVRTVYDYDDLIIAPANGFDDAEDYYARSSASSVMAEITHPVLCIHSANDPWIPLSMYDDVDWPGTGSRSLVVARDGGHVGFHQHSSDVPWHNHCITTYLETIVR